ncbi:MAG: RNA methyltransferase [Candidatus Gastranaerophilales bacterium]|nr:RNA methyltransferase [Candidatus Gastranaerophilales bacterium]
MKKITSKDNEKIKYVAKLILNKKFRETEKKFVVEGFKAVYEACCFGLKLRDVFVHHSFLEKFEFLDENKLTLVDDNILKKISTTESFSKCVAVFDMLDYSLNDLKTKNTIVLLENIKDGGNLGTIIRSANAFGVDGIVLYGDTIDLYNPKVIRSSVGNFLKIPIVKVNDIEAIKTTFRLHTFYATKVDTDVDLKTIKFEEKKVIMFGSEAEGLSNKLFDLADNFFTIKMQNRVESLNLSVAASIVFYSL